MISAPTTGGVRFNRVHKTGFRVTEENLRRLTNEIRTEFEKKEATDDPVKLNFTVTYKDGLVESKPDLESILEDENIGDRRCIELKIEASVGKDILFPKHRCTVEFIDASEKEESWRSVSISVTSLDRDWALILINTLEERIERIRRLSWAYWTKSRQAARFTVYPFMLALGFIFLTSLGGVYGDRESALDDIEARYFQGELTEPQLAIALARNDLSVGSIEAPLPLILPALGLLVLFVLIERVSSVFPSYVFYWGDNVDRVNGRISKAGFAVLMIATLVVTLAGNWLANKFF